MAATSSVAFTEQTQYVMLLTDMEIYFAVGADPTATTTIGENGNVRRLPADCEIGVSVSPGWKVSAIGASAVLQVVELGRDHGGNDNLPVTLNVQSVTVTE